MEWEAEGFGFVNCRWEYRDAELCSSVSAALRVRRQWGMQSTGSSEKSEQGLQGSAFYESPAFDILATSIRYSFANQKLPGVFWPEASGAWLGAVSLPHCSGQVPQPSSPHSRGHASQGIICVYVTFVAPTIIPLSQHTLHFSNCFLLLELW